MIIIIGILLIISLVILHEFGHFLAARRAGIEVEEFGIGFPPLAKILGKKNGTKYTLNWLPLGGFVRLKGEHDSDRSKGSFGAAKISDKVRVMVAGVLMNFLAAVALLTIIAAVGLPKVFDNQFSIASDTKVVRHDVLVGFVADDSPAKTADLEEGDRLISFTDPACDSDSSCSFKIEKSDDLRHTTETLAGKEVTINYARSGSKTIESARVKLLTTEEVETSKTANTICKLEMEETDKKCPAVKGYLGVVPADYIKQRATWSAPIVAVAFSGQVVQKTLLTFGGIIADLFRGDTTTAKDQVTGVVGIGYILKELSTQGFMSVLFLTALISLSLAVMNALPIPALDGGRLFVMLLFRTLRKPLTKEIEERIHGTGFAALMLLFVLITILDVQRFILK